MAPEILRDKKRTFHKEGDVWALGISLLVLITKKQPYSGDSFSILRRQVIAGEREKLPQLSPELTDLMDRFLEMDPSRRIRLEEVMAHPFLKKYSSQLNL
jgi:serine/threonine protein kinase